MPDAASAAAAELVLELLRSGRAAKMVARGQSMRGTIPDGAVLLLDPPPADVVVGDVVLVVLDDGAWVVHRVMACEGQQLLVQGDASLRPDGWCRREQIAGLARAFAHENREQALSRTPPSSWRRLAFAVLGRWNRSRFGA